MNEWFHLIGMAACISGGVIVVAILIFVASECIFLAIKSVMGMGHIANALRAYKQEAPDA